MIHFGTGAEFNETAQGFSQNRRNHGGAEFSEATKGLDQGAKSPHRRSRREKHRIVVHFRLMSRTPGDCPVGPAPQRGADPDIGPAVGHPIATLP